MRRRSLLLVVLAVVSQAGAWRALVPNLPPVHAPTRSPSSDVLLGALPLADGADRLDALAAGLPNTPGVVVAHGTAARLASAYFVVAMRLWPRPVSLVVCQPSPALEQFRVEHRAPAWQWRIDMQPAAPAPLTVGPVRQALEGLCRD